MDISYVEVAHVVLRGAAMTVCETAEGIDAGMGFEFEVGNMVNHSEGWVKESTKYSNARLAGLGWKLGLLWGS